MMESALMLSPFSSSSPTPISSSSFFHPRRFAPPPSSSSPYLAIHPPTHRPPPGQVWYRVREGVGGLRVRRGRDPSSPLLTYLFPGTAIQVEEEEEEEEGGYLRLVSPPYVKGGWVEKQDGVLGEVGGEGGWVGGENALMDMVLGELDDALEEEGGGGGGGEGYRREERYFPSSSSSLSRVGGRRGGAGGRRYEGGGRRSGRRMRMGGWESLLGAWRGLVGGSRTRKEVGGKLTRVGKTLRVLLARQLVVALLLAWEEGGGGGEGGGDMVLSSSSSPPTPLPTSLSASPPIRPPTRDRMVAQGLESLLRLVVFRGVSESGWEARFTRIAVGGGEGGGGDREGQSSSAQAREDRGGGRGRRRRLVSYRSMFSDDAGLLLLSPALRTLPSLLTPVLDRLLLPPTHPPSSSPLPQSPPTHSPTLSPALLETLLSFIHKQVALASARAFAGDGGGGGGEEEQEDVEMLSQPNLQLIRWLTRVVEGVGWRRWEEEEIEKEKSRSETASGGKEILSSSSSSSSSLELLLQLSSAWALAFFSPGLYIKHLASVELASLLSHLLAHLYHTKAEKEGDSLPPTSSLAKKEGTTLPPTHPLLLLLKDLLSLLPSPRLRALTASRLGMENEDAPMYSRYLQVSQPTHPPTHCVP